MKTNPVIRVIRSIASLLFWLVVWQLLSYFVNRILVLPTPIAVIRMLATLLGTGEFWSVCLASLCRIFSGLLIGIVFGTLIAAFCAASRTVDTLISPIISVIKATPVASVIILMLYIIGKGAVPMFAALLMVLPIIFANVRRGIDAVGISEREVARVYGFGFFRRVRYCIIPSVMPYFSAACRSALGIAWKAGIAAEVICYPKNAIGGKLYEAKVYLETEELYAWTVVVIILSFLIEKAVVMLLDKLANKGGKAVAEA